MKKNALFLIGMAVCSIPAYSQWAGSTLTTGNIYRTGYVGIGFTANNALYPLHVFDNSGAGTKTLFGASGTLIGTYNSADAVHQIRSASGAGIFNLYGSASTTSSFHSIGLSTSGTGHFLTYSSSTLSPVNFVIFGNGSERLRILNDAGTKLVVGGSATALLGGFAANDGVYQHHSAGNGYMGLISNKSGSNYIAFSMYTSTTATTIGSAAVGYSAIPMTFSVNGTEAMRIWPSGAIGVGTGSTALNNTKFAVEGLIACRELKVMPLAAAWPDYVFAPDYQRMSFEQLDTYLQTNRHLPHMQSDSAFQANGNSFNVGETQMNLLKSVEELYLYMLDLKKENDAMKKEIEELKKKQ